MGQTTKNSKIINAAASTIYSALTTPAALEVWQAPNDMRARIHNFDLKVGGGYQMSLFYSDNKTETKGKTAGKEDRFTARFIDLIPNKKIVQAINFESPDPAFSGEMMMEVTIEPTDKGTMVTYFFQNIPKGIKPEDNEAGTIATLENLASYVE